MENNLFEVIENIFNSDSKDWLIDYKDALIYGIIFGWDEEESEELLYRFKMDGMTEESIEKVNTLHDRWEFLKQEEDQIIWILEVLMEKMSEVKTTEELEKGKNMVLCKKGRKINENNRGE